MFLRKVLKNPMKRLGIGTNYARKSPVMKNTFKSMMIGGGLLAAAAAPASAGLETELYTGYHSIYEFRGVELGDDGLWDVGVDLTYDLGNGFSLNGGIWFADSYGSAGGDFEEIDYYVGLTKTIGSVDVSVGYIYYDFPGDSFFTDEFFVGVSTEFDNGIGVSLTYYDDYDDDGNDTFEGEYLELEVTKSWEVNPCVTLDLSVGAAWSFDYNGDVDGGALDGLNHYFVSIAAPWAVADNFSVTPYIKYIGADNDLANEYGTGQSEDLFYGGVTLSYSF